MSWISSRPVSASFTLASPAPRATRRRVRFGLAMRGVGAEGNSLPLCAPIHWPTSGILCLENPRLGFYERARNGKYRSCFWAACLFWGHGQERRRAVKGKYEVTGRRCVAFESCARSRSCVAGARHLRSAFSFLRGTGNCSRHQPTIKNRR